MATGPDIGGFLARRRELNLAFVDQGLVSAANFIVGVLVARSLGLDDYGVYTLVWMGVLFLNGQHHSFVVAPMMSFAPKMAPADRPAYYGAVVAGHLLVSAGGLLLLGAGFLIADIVYPHWEGLTYAPSVCAAAFAYQSQDALRRHFFVRETPGDALLVDVAGYGSQVALLLLFFALAEPRTVSAIWAVAGGMGIGALVGALRMDVTLPARREVLDELARHWRFAKWLIGSEIMRWTSENFFVIVSGATLGPFAAGVMNAAKTIMGVTHVLFLGLSNVAPAGAAKALHEGGARALTAYLASVTAYGGALTLIFAGVAALIPSYLMGLVFGAEYAAYGFALQWFAAIYLMTFLHIPLSAGLRALERTGPLFWARGVATVITLLVALPLIDLYGLHGALLGSFLVNVAQQATLFVAFRQALRLPVSG
ncbi:MAG: hypothetical protein HQK87_11040 [Nitrospinae bacterium]|nr:hypothetical protein [Nitrospinota bacterium]